MSFVIGNHSSRLLRLALSTAFAAVLCIGHLVPTSVHAGEADAEAPMKTVKMTVENFKWVPDQLRVAKGTKVVMHIRSYDATHRFDLKKPYNLKVVLPQSKTTEFEFMANHVGTFKWKCGRPCGNGCPKMTGKLTVYDPAEAADDEDD